MINNVYLRKDVQSQMRSSFEQQKALILSDFLNIQGLEEIKKIWNSKGKKDGRADLFSYEKLLDSKFFISQEFLSFVVNIIGKQPKKMTLETRKFGHGDFTLIHDEVKQQRRFILFYRNAKEWKQEWGGQAVFTRGDGEPLIFLLQSNSLVIVDCDSKTFEFTKYINNLAQEKNFIEVKITL